jgi:hypothetical protein
MAAFLDNCRFISTAGGTADWIYASAVGGCQSPAAAGAVDGRKYKFLAISGDLTQWEIAEGTYTAASGTFARTAVLYNSSGTGSATGQSGAGAKISFTAIPNVAIVGVKEDLISIEEANAFTSTQQGRARDNIAAFGAVKKQIFTSSGTYTSSANMLYCIIECWGGGGGGGGTASPGSTIGSGGAGGGAGSYSQKLATAATIGASQAVTLGAAGSAAAAGNNAGGAGGDTSVGTLCIGKGGSGGGGSVGSGDATPGAGGVAGTGDITATGQAGFSFPALVNSHGVGGAGGSSSMGSGGATTMSGATTATGNAATGKASGGAGGAAFNSGAATAGGAGTAGIVVITEFCSS